MNRAGSIFPFFSFLCLGGKRTSCGFKRLAFICLPVKGTHKPALLFCRRAKTSHNLWPQHSIIHLPFFSQREKTHTHTYILTHSHMNSCNAPSETDACTLARKFTHMLTPMHPPSHTCLNFRSSGLDFSFFSAKLLFSPSMVATFRGCLFCGTCLGCLLLMEGVMARGLGCE